MAFKVIGIFAAAVLVQVVYSQQCSCSSGYGNQVISPIGLGGLAYGSGSGCGNLGYSDINSGLNYGSSSVNLGGGSQGLETLTITTGSSYAPGCISVYADNLEMGGQLLVSGQMPILGTVVVSADVPNGGQGQVQYSTAPGVGLTSGGCGYGLASSGPSVAYGYSGLSGNSGLVGGSCGVVGIGQGYSRGCECGL